MAGITKRVGEFGAESIHTRPETGKRPCKVACSWEFFTGKNVNKNTYICALHWPGVKGPTDELLDPLKANLTPKKAGQAFTPKRKALKSREETVTKQTMVIRENNGKQSDELMEVIPTDDWELLESSTTDDVYDKEIKILAEYLYQQETGESKVQKTEELICEWRKFKYSILQLKSEMPADASKPPKNNELTSQTPTDWLLHHMLSNQSTYSHLCQSFFVLLKCACLCP